MDAREREAAAGRGGMGGCSPASGREDEREHEAALPVAAACGGLDGRRAAVHAGAVHPHYAPRSAGRGGVAGEGGCGPAGCGFWAECLADAELAAARATVTSMEAADAAALCADCRGWLRLPRQCAGCAGRASVGVGFAARAPH